MAMSESKYCDVLLNLRNTGVNAMKSYYANSYSSASFEKYRIEHAHFKPPLDKYAHGVSCLQSPSKVRKYECTSSYQTLDNRKSRYDTTLLSPDGKMSYRLPDNKLNPGYIVGPSPPDRTRLSSDVHNVSSYAHKLSQYCGGKVPNFDNNNPYCKRTYESISTHSNTSEDYHLDIKPPRHDPHLRFKYTPYKNDTSYNSNHRVFYSHKNELDKTYPPNNHHTNYEHYRLPAPCPLPCCSSFNYEAKPVENRSYYGRRGSLSPTYSPSVPSNVKKTDYPEHMQGLSTREPNESSAFSPIRPSHIRRVHSTESGYSSESNGTCNSTNSYKDLEVCKNPKCCAMLDLNSPTIGQKVCRDIGSQINAMERQKHASSEQRENVTNEHERGHIPSEHPSRFHHTSRAYEFEDHRQSIHDHKALSREEYQERRMSVSRYQNNVWREQAINEKHREDFNIENLRRSHSADEEKRRHSNSDDKNWKPAMDLHRSNDSRILPTQPIDKKLEVCDEASRAAMKAFDAHVRKMIATSRDSNSSDVSPKLQHTSNESHHPFNTSTEDRILCNRSTEYNDPKNQLNNNKHSTSPVNEKYSVNHLSNGKISPNRTSEDKKSPSPLNKGKNSLILLSTDEDQICDENHTTKTLGDENIPPDQSCDSTQKVEVKEEECVNDPAEKHATEKIKNEVLDGTKAKDEPPSPQPELQCPAVDSTLNDDASSTPEAVGGLLGLTRVANEHLGQALAKEKKRSKNNNCLHLWQFLRRMLDQEQDKVGRCIEWTNRETGEFRLIKTAVIADLWGQSKNRTCMTYEKMARAMRYYYKMNILEKVPHKRLHFRFGERILSKVLNPTNSKPFIGKNKIFDDMYNLSKRNLNANYNPAAMLKQNNAIVNDFRNGHNLNFLQMQAERGKNTITYLPSDLPGVTLPPYYNDHNNNILHHNIPHITSNRIPELPPPPRELTQKRTEPPSVLPCNIPRKLVPNSVNTSPGSNPSVSPYSGEETPETWSDIDSNDELVVDTDSE